MTTSTLPETVTETTDKVALPWHVIAQGPDGEWEDKALCGFLWDRFNVKPIGPACAECIAELKRREAM